MKKFATGERIVLDLTLPTPPRNCGCLNPSFDTDTTTRCRGKILIVRDESYNHFRNHESYGKIYNLIGISNDRDGYWVQECTMIRANDAASICNCCSKSNSCHRKLDTLCSEFIRQKRSIEKAIDTSKLKGKIIL